MLAQVAAGPITALELPKVDLPAPLPKKDILPVVPVYTFKLPDIKGEILALGKDKLDRLAQLINPVCTTCHGST